MLTPDEEELFFSVLRRFSFVHEPPSAFKAYGLFALYCLIELGAQFAWRTDETMPSWAVSLTMWGAVSTVGIALVHRLFPECSRTTWQFYCGMAILVVGYIVTVPAALLVMPMLVYGSRKRLYDRLHVGGVDVMPERVSG